MVLLSGVDPAHRSPHDGMSEGAAAQAHSTESFERVCSDAAGIVTDSTVPGVRRGLAPPVLARRLADLTPRLPRRPECRTRIRRR